MLIYQYSSVLHYPAPADIPGAAILMGQGMGCSGAYDGTL
jgi:hypothetical protein